MRLYGLSGFLDVGAGQLIGDRLTEFLVAGVAGMVAKAHNAGGQGECAPCRLVDAHLYHQLRVVKIYLAISCSVLLNCLDCSRSFNDALLIVSHRLF